MSQVILTNWTIWFADDADAGSSGMKQIQWTGGGGPEDNTNTVNELYSELMHYFSIVANNDADDTTPMRAVTPDVFQIGAFDQGDLEPWFIDPDSVEHLTGGSIQSVGWTRVQDANAGIVKVAYTPTTNQFITSDIGRGVTHDDGDTGTLLWFDTTAGEAWIRPTDDTSTHNWDSGANDFTVDSGTGDVSQTAAAVTGERLWSNIVTIGTISDNTRIYVAQDNTVLANFWGDGDSLTNQIDRLFLVNDGFDAGLIDGGELTIYARQFTRTYDHFIADLSGGGQTSVPLSTQNEINNNNGYRTVDVTGASSAFEVGEVVTGGTSGGEVVVTANTGSPTTSFEYYIVGDLTDLNASSDALTGSVQGANGSTNGSQANVNAATYTDITFDVGSLQDTFATSQAFTGDAITTTGTHPFETEDLVTYYRRSGDTENVGLTVGTFYYVNDLGASSISLHTSASDALADQNRVSLSTSGAETHVLKRTFDINDDSTKDDFSIIIDGAGRPLSEIFEHLKYVTRRGETTDTFAGIEGQQFISIDYRVDYNTLTGTIVAGNTLTQALASGDTLETIVVHHNEVEGYLMLRDTQNAPFDVGSGAANLQIDGSNFVDMTGSTSAEAITPNKSSPFGSLAGSTFIGARGVVLENIDGLDANNVQYTDDGGNTVTPPVTVTFQLTGLVADSEVRLCNSADDTEISGTESSSTTFSYQYVYASDITAHVIIHHVDYIWQRINGLTLSTADQSIPIQQQADRNYSNP